MPETKKAGTPSVKQLLADLKAFAIHIAATATEQGERIPFIPSRMFSTQEYGGLSLSGEDADRYSGIIAGLLENMGEAMSERSVTKLVQTAILKTLDLNKRN